MQLNYFLHGPLFSFTIHRDLLVCLQLIADNAALVQVVYYELIKSVIFQRETRAQM